MIGIINYGSGNIHALGNIYKNLGIDYFISENPEELKSATRLILPGVGAFDETMNQINVSGLREIIDYKVKIERTPILGICVGMQILGNSSDEGSLNGLGLIQGHVRKFNKNDLLDLPKLPHMGWNQINPKTNSILFENIDHEMGFYFLHSYFFDVKDDSNTLATTSYGIEFSSAIICENIIGAQFHPEKSHSNGINFLRNFSKFYA